MVTVEEHHLTLPPEKEPLQGSRRADHLRVAEGGAVHCADAWAVAEVEAKVTQLLVRRYSASVILVYLSLGFTNSQTGTLETNSTVGGSSDVNWRTPLLASRLL